MCEGGESREGRGLVFLNASFLGGREMFINLTRMLKSLIQNPGAGIYYVQSLTKKVIREGSALFLQLKEAVLSIRKTPSGG